MTLGPKPWKSLMASERCAGRVDFVSSGQSLDVVTKATRLNVSP